VREKERHRGRPAGEGRAEDAPVAETSPRVGVRPPRRARGARPRARASASRPTGDWGNSGNLRVSRRRPVVPVRCAEASAYDSSSRKVGVAGGAEGAARQHGARAAASTVRLGLPSAPTRGARLDVSRTRPAPGHATRPSRRAGECERLLERRARRDSEDTEAVYPERGATKCRRPSVRRERRARRGFFDVSTFQPF
jgi:hypothetical protein